MSRNLLSDFGGEVEAFVHAVEPWLRSNRDSVIYNDIYSVVSAARSYLLVLEYYDERFLTYVMVFGGDLRVRLYCLDPSDVLSHCMSRGVASILFSATFTPLDYFIDLLGGGKKARQLNLPTPFKQENLFVGAVDTVSTRYDDRNEKTYHRIAALIAAAVSQRAGNYIVYFPSYAFMEGVREVFEKKFPKVKLVVQNRGMGRAEKERFLSEFKEDVGKLRIGMCVLGGSFSEGVDLPGSKIIGTVVVGVGLPGISNENNIIKEYYDVKSECGYDYAYTFPGMNNVLQAAGRVIRTHEDSGIVVLADDRYATPKYRALFPEHWSGVQYAGNASSLAEIIRRFWENRS
jgi:Rad3-related DNA helicase